MDLIFLSLHKAEIKTQNYIFSRLVSNFYGSSGWLTLQAIFSSRRASPVDSMATQVFESDLQLSVIFL